LIVQVLFVITHLDYVTCLFTFLSTQARPSDGNCGEHCQATFIRRVCIVYAFYYLHEAEQYTRRPVERSRNRFEKAVTFFNCQTWSGVHDDRSEWGGQ